MSESTLYLTLTLRNQEPVMLSDFCMIGIKLEHDQDLVAYNYVTRLCFWFMATVEIL